jgi:hypothetical protein
MVGSHSRLVVLLGEVGGIRRVEPRGLQQVRVLVKLLLVLLLLMVVLLLLKLLVLLLVKGMGLQALCLLGVLRCGGGVCLGTVEDQVRRDLLVVRQVRVLHLLLLLLLMLALQLLLVHLLLLLHHQLLRGGGGGLGQVHEVLLVQVRRVHLRGGVLDGGVHRARAVR